MSWSRGDIIRAIVLIFAHGAKMGTAVLIEDSNNFFELKMSTENKPPKIDEIEDYDKLLEYDEPLADAKPQKDERAAK